ncbi:MAG: hypothetical protein CMJ40_08175 [Phycisphaerae bacterium]|nr:hypothetical protein [Phycisphaerae bacterium]
MSIVRSFRRNLNRKTVAVVLSGQGLEYVRSLDETVLSKVVSFPDYYRENSPVIRELDDQEILDQSREVEAQLGVSSVNPYHYYDRDLRKNGDWNHVIRRHLLNLRFVAKLLVDARYYFVRGENVTHIGCLIQQAAHGLGHRYIRPSNARLPNRLEFGSRILGPNCGMEAAYDRIRSGATDDTTKKAVEQADQWLASFLDNPSQPSWALRNSRTRLHLSKRVYQYAQIGLQRATRPLRQSRDARRFDREARMTGFPGANFVNQMLLPDLRRMLHLRRSIFRRAVSMEGDFVYMPLQYSPEISTLVYGYRYEDQMNLVRTLAAYLPTGCRLLVKDHMSMMGRRPYAFYKELESFYNVQVVSPSVSTFELLNKCRAVATNTGTPGWEGFVMGKPVLVFGDVFYRYFPNVLGLEFSQDMGEKIRSYLDNFKADETVIRNCVASYFASTYGCTMVDIGEDTPPDKVEEQADLFAEACRWAVESLEDDFPIDWEH